MTLGQAAYRGIAKLRRPSWEPDKCIELQFDRDPDGKPNGSVQPWVTLREGATEESVLIFTLIEEEDWEPIEETHSGLEAPGQA